MEVRWGPALKHFFFALSQLWGFMVFWPGGGGDSHMEQTGMLVGNFEFNP